jgi:hypothetical protein
MAVKTKVLIDNDYTVPNSPSYGIGYAVDQVTTIIDKFTATNYGASSATLSVWIVTVLQGFNIPKNLVVKRTLAANETYIFPEMVGQVMLNGDTIGLQASAGGSISVRACGREIN